jgi:hypothetical protein
MTRVYVIRRLHLRHHSPLDVRNFSLLLSPLILKAQRDKTDQPVF